MRGARAASFFFRLVVIEKHYRGSLSRTVADGFWREVSALRDRKEMAPVVQRDRYVLAHVQHGDLVLLAVVDDEMPALMAVDFLYRTLDIFKDYFGPVSAEVLQVGGGWWWSRVLAWC